MMMFWAPKHLLTNVITSKIDRRYERLVERNRENSGRSDKSWARQTRSIREKFNCRIPFDFPSNMRCRPIMPHRGWTPAWLGLSLQPLLVQIRVRSTYALTSSIRQDSTSAREHVGCRFA